MHTELFHVRSASSAWIRRPGYSLRPCQKTPRDSPASLPCMKMPFNLAYIVQMIHIENVAIDIQDVYITAGDPSDLARHNGERTRARNRVTGMRDDTRSSVEGRRGRRISTHTKTTDAGSDTYCKTDKRTCDTHLGDTPQQPKA